MHIAITGSTGFIGSALIQWFTSEQHSLTRLVRDPAFKDPRHQIALWNPQKKIIHLSSLEAHDVVIHLAGENIAKKKWTEEQKNKIKESRVQGTTFLCDSLARLQNPPKLLLSASAIGFYGNRSAQEKIDESSLPGQGFLPEVAQAWEKATDVAQKRGIRVIHMRFGLVLARHGGALSRMLPLFKAGLGGRIGSGKQMMSWISLYEIGPVISHVMMHKEISGPVNFVSPEPLSNEEFSSVLARSLSRPALFPLPAFMARLLLGEMAEELLLSGAAIIPKKLKESGYVFKFPSLQEALRHVLQ